MLAVLGRAEAWIEGKSFFSGNTAPVILLDSVFRILIP